MDVLAQTRALRERSQRLTVEFLHADLDYGYTLCTHFADSQDAPLNG
jgi:hypothetical protein